MRGLVVSFFLCLVGCEARLSLGATCARTGDCPAPLVCSHARCRSECTMQRDCPIGTTCRFDGDGNGSCSLLDDVRCIDDTSCPAGLVCIGDDCVNLCADRTECPAGSECVLDVPSGRTRCVRPPGDDAGLVDDAAAPDSGADGGPPDAPEPIDAAFDGGMPPPVPRPLAPANGALTGSALAAVRGTLRPRFRWTGAATTYDLQVDGDCPSSGFAACTFPSPELDVRGLVGSEHIPTTDLPVAMTAPVGRRYYWRVRACTVVACSAWSSVRYVDVGRVRSDYDGDGRSDVVVGAYQADRGVVDRGDVFVFAGTGAAGGSIGGPALEAGAWLGVHVGFAGDVNADGFGDLLAGATVSDGGIVDSGEAFLFLGAAGGLPSAPSVTLASAGENDGRFGVVTEGAGDVNGDGLADVIVGAYNEDGGRGRAYLWLGRAATPALGPVADVTFTLPGGEVDAHFGAWCSAAGDLDADGYADVVVTAQDENASATDAGRVFLYLGGPSGPVPVPSRTLGAPVPQPGAILGWSASAAGDLDDDGFADFAVGAPGEDAGGAGAGVVYVWYGDATVSLARLTRIPSPTGEAGGHFGSSIAAGDFDGDGVDELVVGAHRVNAGAIDEGNVYVFGSDASGVSMTAWRTIDNPENDASGAFGYAVAAGGDTTGDGYEDAVLGAPDDTLVQTNDGAAYVFAGSSTGLPATRTRALAGPAEMRAHFGFGVAL